MQLAALAAVISHFWRDVSDLLFGSLSAIGRRDFSDRSLKLAFGIAVGTDRCLCECHGGLLCTAA